MGIIRRQSISGTVYSYIGVILGFILSGILLPNLLSESEIGLLRVLVSYSILLAQFAVFGFNTVTIKLFPDFRDLKQKHHGFLGLALLISLAGFILTITIYLGFHDYIISNAREKSALFISYYYLVIPLVFFTLLFSIFDNYYRVLYNAVKGIVYKEVIQRILIIFSVIVYYLGYVNFNMFVILYSISIASPAIFLLIALFKDKVLFIKPDLSFIDKELRKKMLNIAIYGVIAGYSGVLAQNIDLIMVNHYLGLSSAGIYTITFFFGTLILIPLRTMGKISSVVVSDAWKINDKKTILDIYRKSSSTLSVFGIFIFIGILANIDNIFEIIGRSYESGRYVIFFIALASLTDVFMGVSPHIIVNSPEYKWLTYILITYAILIVILNLVFIPIFGLVGAAFATFLSKSINNLMKFGFLYWKYKFQPFNIKILYLFIIGGFSLWISSIAPNNNSFILDILIKSSLISIIFIPAVYVLRVSDDVNVFIDKLFR